MDSLLANYASSDEEEAEVQKPQLQSQPSSLFSSLPKPNPKPPSSSSSSLFSSLPPPKHEPQEFQDDEESKPPISRSSLFSSLPKPKLEDPIDSKPPKSQFPKKPQSLSSSSSSQNPKKKVVQFKPPVFVNPTQFDDEDDDDDDEEEERLRRRKAAEASSAQPLSVTSFLSSIPAPRNSATLGVSSGLGSGSGSGRRAIVETEAIVPKVETKTETDVVGVSYPDSESSFDHNAVGYGGYGGGYESYQYGIDQNVESGGAQLQAGFHGNASSYGNYSGYGESEWADGPAAAAAPVEFKGSGKRRRNDVPTEIVEVKQDELMKNRPREDQAKVTGIAFGPSYQPVATKGKPTKLHKRKHQIGSLYFDMKQKEMELTERRSRGFLTKAETQAKYGW